MTNGRLSKKDIIAIEKAVEKYNLIAIGCLSPIGNLGVKTCNLCYMYWYERDCRGCPVYNRTKIMGCILTPHKWIVDNQISIAKKLIGHPRFEQGITAVEDEIEFLISLLPKSHILRKE